MPDRPPNDAHESSEPCSKGCVLYTDDGGKTLKVLPLICKRWTCPSCRPYLTKLWVDKIVAAKPERFITITCDPKMNPTPNQALRRLLKAWPKFVAQLRKEGKVFEYCAALDVQRSGYPHFHVFQKGDYVPQKKISLWFQNAGVGHVQHIERIKSAAQAAMDVSDYVGRKALKAVNAFPFVRYTRSSRNFFSPPSPASLADEDIDHHVAYAPMSREHVIARVQDLGYELAPADDGSLLRGFTWPAERGDPPELYEVLYHCGIAYEYLDKFVHQARAP